MKMNDDLEKWLKGKGEKVLHKIGIRKGQIILDFGCGSGEYTIPAARIIGENGIVYALDMDKEVLDELMRRAELEGLRNIKRMATHGEVEINLNDGTVDAVLLYDIFWYFPLTDPRLTKLLAEVHRITKPDALISVYPKHIDSDRLKDRIEKAGFRLRDKYSGMFIHEGQLEKGEILNFIKASLFSKRNE